MGTKIEKNIRGQSSRSNRTKKMEGSNQMKKFQNICSKGCETTHRVPNTSTLKYMTEILEHRTKNRSRSFQREKKKKTYQRVRYQNNFRLLKLEDHGAMPSKF